VRKHLFRASRGAGSPLQSKAPCSTDHFDLGDDPTQHRLGSVCAGPTTYGDALEVLRRHGVDAAPAVMGHLEGGRARRDSGNTQTGDETFRASKTRYRHGAHALRAAQDFSICSGFQHEPRRQRDPARHPRWRKCTPALERQVARMVTR